MVKQELSDRRRATRAERILCIQYRLIKSKHKNRDTKWYLSTTQDMSVLGMSFLSEVPFHTDEVLELNVIMSGVLDIYKGLGRVVRVEKKETGAFYLIAVKFEENKGVKKTRKTGMTGKREIVKHVKI